VWQPADRSWVPRSAALGIEDDPAGIDMTPMIDVMMALLIIFMVVTPILADYVARLPEAVYVAPEPGEDVVTIGVDAGGRVFVGSEHVEEERLVERLREVYAARPGDHLAYLRADRDVDYAVVRRVLLSARDAGVRTIGALASPVLPAGAPDASVGEEASDR